MKVSLIFEGIRRDFEKYQNDITAVFDKYKGEISKAATDVKKFKDENAEFEQRKATYVSEARKAINAADMELCNSLNLVRIPKLRDALCNYITEKPTGTFLDTLRIYRDFGVPLSKQEVKILMHETLGGYLALRCLSSLAAESQINVTTPDVSTFLKDIEALERLSCPPIQWSPSGNGNLRVAIDIFQNVKRRNAKNGEVLGDLGRMEPVDAIAASLPLNNIVSSLDEIANRWESTFIPSLNDFEPQEMSDGIEVSAIEQWGAVAHASLDKLAVEDANDSSVEVAHEIGKTRAESQNKARETINSYKL